TKPAGSARHHDRPAGFIGAAKSRRRGDVLQPFGRSALKSNPQCSLLFIFFATIAIVDASRFAAFMIDTASSKSSASMASKKSSSRPMPATCSKTRVPSKSLSSISVSLAVIKTGARSWFWQDGGHGESFFDFGGDGVLDLRDRGVRCE